PTFRILEPSPDRAVMDTCTIAVTFQGQDNAAIVRFEAYVDAAFVVGGSVKNPIVAGSFQVPCDLRKAKVAPGTHTLTVKLMDSLGRATEVKQQITVTAQVEHIPPTVRIVAPKANAGIGAKGATIQIEARDDSGIKWVMLYINGQFRAMMNEPPYLVPWNPVKERMASGTYTLRARAFDYFDNEAMSEPVVVQVDAGGPSPIELPRIASQQPLGLFPVTAVPVAAGPAVPRQPFANLIAPFAHWHGLPSLPDRFAARRDLPQLAESGGLLLLPPKALPGAPAVPAATDDRILGPLMALAQYVLPRPQMAGMSMPTAFTPLYVPAPTLARAERPEPPAPPVPFTAILPPHKGVPAIEAHALYAVAATPAAPAPDPVAKGPVARVAAAGATPMHVPAGAAVTTPSAAARAETPAAPVLVALVPGALLKLTPPAPPLHDIVAVPAQETTAPPVRLPEKVAPTGRNALTPALPETANTAVQPAPGAGIVRPASAPRVSSSQETLTPGEPQAAVPVAPPLQLAKAVPSIETAPRPAMTVAPVATDPQPADSAPLTRLMPDTVQPAIGGLSSATMEVIEPYLVQRGDTLEQIARAYATTPDALMKLNPGLSPERPLPVNSAITVPQSEVRLYLDNLPLEGGLAPFVSNGFTMVPMRQVVEAKDGVVIWLPQTREVNAWAQNTFMNVKIGQRQARINDALYQLPVAPSLLESRTMVPLRYLMEALDLRVEYNAASGTYYLVSRSTP
ncbi:MAG TPA: stalk domain-containing protein, partial [Armatimonadota bacterium]|nr:stalk domain-containing protein [Armatimonadota bacterium]